MVCGDDEDGDFSGLDVPEGIAISGDGQIPTGLVNPGGPFSALISSMVPQEILFKLNSSKDPEDPNEQPEYRYFIYHFVVRNLLMYSLKEFLFC